MSRFQAQEKALIVVDLQNDFCPGGALAVPEGDAVVPLVNALVPHFGLVVATQDWHPPGHCSFAEQPRYVDRSWPRHCVAGTPGAELHGGLNLGPEVPRIHKGVSVDQEAYSGFAGTGLRELLARQGIRSVYVCGLATDYCVKATALDARRAGFATFVVTDACRGVDLPRGSVERAWEELRAAGIHLTDSVEVLKAGSLPG